MTPSPHPNVITTQPEFWALEWASSTPATTPQPSRTSRAVPTVSGKKTDTAVERQDSHVDAPSRSAIETRTYMRSSSHLREGAAPHVGSPLDMNVIRHHRTLAERHASRRNRLCQLRHTPSQTRIRQAGEFRGAGRGAYALGYGSRRAAHRRPPSGPPPWAGAAPGTALMRRSEGMLTALSAVRVVAVPVVMALVLADAGRGIDDAGRRAVRGRRGRPTRSTATWPGAGC